MLTSEDLSFFRTFGYVVVRPPREAARLVRLGEECSRAVSLAYRSPQSGALQLPAMSVETPLSIEMIHDTDLLQGVRELLGPSVIVKPPKITQFVKPTNWHRDCYTPLRGLKMAVYFPSDPPGVTFDLVPASHVNPVLWFIDNIFGKDVPAAMRTRDPARMLPSRVPCHSFTLRAGDILFFDLGLWHAHLGSYPRLQWGVTYFSSPTTRQGVIDVVEHLGEFFEQSWSYQRELFPRFPRSWESNDDPSDLSRTMHSSGVFEEYLSRYGRGS